MDLPVRIVTEAPAEPAIFVDGAAPPGAQTVLELSHWPGNGTPAALRHDLSTGCALRFARLPATERAELAADAQLLANNHYDTDGTLALFAARFPEQALAHEDALLDAARAGDFFEWPDDRALAIDAIVQQLSNHADSPLAHTAGWSELDDAERWNRCTQLLLEELPGMLTGALEPWRALWEPVVARAHLDRDTLARATRTDDETRSLTAWTIDDAAPQPGRHALFGATEADRVLVLAPSATGTRCRLVLSTKSWFDLVTRAKRPRPDLEALAARLNELEGGSDPHHAWRTQPSASPSPELWFGAADLPLFVEHNDALAPSRLDADVVQRELERALAD